MRKCGSDSRPLSHWLAALALFFMLVPVVGAADPVRWEVPERLTSEDSRVQFSTIVADPYGGVHAFWAHSADSSEPSGYLFYSYIDDLGATQPFELFAGQDGEAFSLPQAYCDHTGRLHLVWSSVKGLYYSTAQASEASDVRRWTAPSWIVRDSAMGSVDLVVDASQRVHVVYSRRAAGTNVSYVRSEDLGATWTQPALLSDIPVGAEQVPDSARIALDSHDGLHVVWAEHYPPEYIGRQVFYSRSEDGGLSWARPYPMSERSADTWNAVPGIVVDSAGSIHVMWAGCGNPVARCYRFSSDGGSTWSDSSKPFSDLVGSSGRDAMVADPYGGVRWFGSLRYPQALYAAELAEGIWADPPQAVVHEGSYGGLGSGHFPAMTISGGNRVHVTVVESDGGPLWHLRGTTSFPAIAVAPLPTIPVPTPSLAATADSTANSGATVIPAVTAVPASNSGYATEAFPLVLASATAAVVVVVAVVFAFRIRDR